MRQIKILVGISSQLIPTREFNKRRRIFSPLREILLILNFDRMFWNVIYCFSDLRVLFKSTWIKLNVYWGIFLKIMIQK